MRLRIHVEPLAIPFRSKIDMRYLIFIFILSLNSFAAESQLRLVHADKSIGKIVNGEPVRILTGNVEAYQDTLHMLCDEAYFYQNQNRIEFIGRVFIDDGQHILRAERINYYPETKTAICLKNVRISSQTDSLYAEKFVYNFSTKNAEGEQNLFVWDKQNNAWIWGDKGKYDYQKEYTRIENNAHFKHYNQGEADTLDITSRFMEYQAGKNAIAMATDSVTIRQGDLVAACDSAKYDIDQEKIHLKVDPIAWQAESEMKGNTIDLMLDSLILTSIFIDGDAQIKSLSDSVDKTYDYLRGKTIEVMLKENKPHLITARNNASSIYLLKDKEVRQGTNSASSDSIIIHFEAGVMDSIAIIGGAEGKFYPPDYKGETELE
jgi:lipopolysaccharide export system protein LptA